MIIRQEFSSLRQGLVGAWCPSLGASGLTLIDRSGLNNHGTLTNMGGQDNWRGLGSGVALNFDGTNDLVSLGDKFGGFSQMSVSCWFTTRVIPSSVVTAEIVAKWGNHVAFDSTDSFLLGVGANQGIRWFLGGPNAGVSSGPSVLAINTLYHVAGVYNGAAVQLFVNGVLSATTNATGAINLASGQDSRLGKATAASGSAQFNGLLDDIRIYNRALTSAEIRLLASRRGIGLTPLPDRAVSLPRKLFVNVGGTWRDGDAYVNDGGTWKLGTPFVNAGGTWK